MKQLLIFPLLLFVLLGCTPTNYGEGVARPMQSTEKPPPELIKMRVGDHGLQFNTISDFSLVDVVSLKIESNRVSGLGFWHSGWKYEVQYKNFPYDFSRRVEVTTYPKLQDETVENWIARHMFGSERSSPLYPVYFFGSLDYVESFTLNGWDAVAFDDTMYGSGMYRKVIVFDFHDHFVEIFYIKSCAKHTYNPGVEEVSLGTLPCTGWNLGDEYEYAEGMQIFETIVDTIRVPE